MRVWSLVCLAFALAGCTAPGPTADDSTAAPESRNPAQPRVEPFEFAGDLGLELCVVPSGPGCGGPALPSGDDVVRFKAGLSSIDLAMTWQAATPASQFLSISVFCPDLPDSICPGGPLRVEGPSPLVIQGVVNVPAGTYANLVVQTVNPGEPAGMFMQVHDTTTFMLTGTLTYHDSA